MRALVIFLILSANLLHAAEQRLPEPGECVVFREGGRGYILRYPTYYVMGNLVEIYKRPHRMALCPARNKQREHFSREDWRQLAEAYPCVTDPALEADVEAYRVRMKVTEWDTPWGRNHGTVGMLFRGHYLNIELKEGIELDIDATLLQRCEDDD